MKKERYLQSQIQADLKRKMVFVGGPRQVGKTTIAKQLLQEPLGYLNWDSPLHRERILKHQFPPSPLWVFDELHKYRLWRSYLKGTYDLDDKKHQILVMGSARLDFYRFGGDSLQGRYHYLRLHPFSVKELNLTLQKELNDLLILGGFPEPFLIGSEMEAKRWSREYRNRLLHEDLTSLERVNDLSQMELLTLRLPELVGSPLSINSLREDLQTSHKTVSRWVSILERLYAIFRLLPFQGGKLQPKIRAVQKEQKHYHFDWSLVPEPSLRFENMVASHLLKWVHFREDAEGRDVELRYFRDIDGREVDFVVLENRKPLWFIDCKWNDTDIGRGLLYLKTRFPNCEAWQISFMGQKDYLSKEGIRVCPAYKFLQQLV